MFVHWTKRRALTLGGLFAACILAAAGLFYLFVYLPQCAQIEKLTLEANAGQEKIAEIERFLTAHPDLAAYERETRAKLEMLAKKLPDDHEISAFVAQAQQAANDSGVTLIRVAPGQANARGAYTETPLLVEFKGNYVQTLDFIRKLERIERFNLIDRMELKSREGSLRGKFMVFVYAFQDRQSVQKEENGEETSNSTME